VRTDTRPIGYWLKHLHTLLEHDFETDIGIGRRNWQLIHLMAHDGAPAVRTRDELFTALDPFWNQQGEPTLDDVLARLVEDGWLVESAPGWQVTATGRVEHDRIWERVAATRARLMTGLNSEDYTRTLHVLATMATNLEQDRSKSRG
jgi:hypothetical protein